MDYGTALQAYYANGAAPNWQDNFISAYATSHPWEDFAETWAHYLHIVDTLEMARAFGLYVHPRLARPGELDAQVDFDPYNVRDAVAVDRNLDSVEQCAQQPQPHHGACRISIPSSCRRAVVEKLSAIHDLIHGNKLPAQWRYDQDCLDTCRGRRRSARFWAFCKMRPAWRRPRRPLGQLSRRRVRLG